MTASTITTNPIEDFRATMAAGLIPQSSISDRPTERELMENIIALEGPLESLNDTLLNLFALGLDQSDAGKKADHLYGEMWNRNEDLKDKLAHMLMMRHYEREN